MGSYARGVRTGCHSCHKGDQNTLISLIATQASCRTRGSRVRQHSGWAIPNLPVVTRAPIVACGNGFVMRRRAIAFLCHVVSLFWLSSGSKWLAWYQPRPQAAHLLPSSVSAPGGRYTHRSSHWPLVGTLGRSRRRQGCAGCLCRRPTCRPC